MTRRFAVPLDQLEAQSRVAAADQQEVQTVPRLDEPLVAGPHVHPYGDGATGADDGDGD
jgi:hypothetical protein